MTRLESDGLVAKLPHARYIVAPLMDRVALDNLRLHAHARGNRLYFRAGIAEEALHEHERVIASIEARDGEQAFAHMQQHLEASRERLRAVSDEYNEYEGR
jgi:DNA-binding GntR family transcriptional regulator